MKRIALVALASVLVFYISNHYLAQWTAVRVVVVIGMPVVIWLFAKFLVEVIPDLNYLASKGAHEDNQGRYYVFAGRHIRFYMVDEVLWIPVKDVEKLISYLPDQMELRVMEAEYGLIPGQKITGYTETGLVRLLTIRTKTRHATPQMIKFKRWLEHEALPNVRRLPASAAGLHASSNTTES